MSLTPRRLLATAAALVAAASLAAVAGTAVAAAPTHHARAAVSTAPKVGTCYAMKLKQIAPRDNRAAKVPCSESHTAIAIAVATAPKRIDLSDDTAYGQYASKICVRAFDKTIGSTLANRNLTSYSLAVFSGTPAEIKAGDRSVECDAILYGGKRTLAPLPSKLKLSGKPPFDDAVRYCLDVVGSHQYRTICARAHDYRSTKDFVLKGKAYPGAAAFDKAAVKRCGKTTSVTYPTEEQWKAGIRYTICFDKTRR